MTTSLHKTINFIGQLASQAGPKVQVTFHRSRVQVITPSINYQTTPILLDLIGHPNPFHMRSPPRGGKACKKCATCFTKLLQIEFNSGAVRFTTLLSTLSCNKLGFCRLRNQSSKERLVLLFLQQTLYVWRTLPTQGKPLLQQLT